MKRAYIPQIPHPAARMRFAKFLLATHTPARRWWWGFRLSDRCTYAWHRGCRWPCREATWAIEESRGNGTVYTTQGA